MSESALEKRKYLFAVLQLNPATQADQIISLRQRMLGFAEVVKHDPNSQKAAELRQKVIERIETIRTQFWTQSADQLRLQLENLPVAKFRDLKANVDRLKLLLVYRDQINGLSREQFVSINLLNTFKRMVMSTPLQAGKLKERYLREHSSSSRTNKTKNMVRMLRKKYPQIYEFEPAWFDEILRVKVNKAQPEYDNGGYDNGGGFEFPGWIIGVVVVIVIRIIVASMRLGGN